MRITRWSTVDAVKAEHHRVASEASWLEKYHWLEFCKLRRAFLDEYRAARGIPVPSTEAGREQLIAAFVEWVQREGAGEWWGGTWAGDSCMVDWHVNQYVAMEQRKIKKGQGGDGGSTDSSKESSTYWDPTRAE